MRRDQAVFLVKREPMKPLSDTFPQDTLLVVGHARPAKEDAINLTHGEFYLALVLDRTVPEGSTRKCAGHQ